MDSMNVIILESCDTLRNQTLLNITTPVLILLESAPKRDFMLLALLS
jgi:hypothetical protein